MNKSEARLYLFNAITDFFIEMGGDEEEMTAQEKAEVAESFAELTDILLDMLRLEIVKSEDVEDGYEVTARMFLS